MPNRHPHPKTPTLSEAQVEQIRAWANLWKVPGLEERVQIRFSRRMFRTLGRYLPGRHEIRLATFLTDAGWEELFAEVLCHEAAHAACYEQIGWNGRPHGREWKALMSTAGYAPRARLPQSPALREVVLARRAARRAAKRAAGRSPRPEATPPSRAWARFRQFFG